MSSKVQTMIVPFIEHECSAMAFLYEDKEGDLYVCCLHNGKVNKIKDGHCLGCCEYQEPYIYSHGSEEIVHHPEVDDIMRKGGLVPINDNIEEYVERTDVDELIRQIDIGKSVAKEQGRYYYGK